MAARQELYHMADVVLQVHAEGEPVTPEDLELDSITEVAQAVETYRDAKRAAAAMKQVEAAAGVQLARLLGEGGAVRVGNDVVRYRKPWTESCTDPQGLEEVLGMMLDDNVPLSDLFNPAYVKRSRLPEAVRNTFFVREEGDDPKLQVTPMDRAPQFLQGLDDGEALVRTKGDTHG